MEWSLSTDANIITLTLREEDFSLNTIRALPFDASRSIEGSGGREPFEKVRRQKEEIRQTDIKAPFYINTLGLTVCFSNSLTFWQAPISH